MPCSAECYRFEDFESLMDDQAVHPGLSRRKFASRLDSVFRKAKRHSDELDFEFRMDLLERKYGDRLAEYDWFIELERLPLIRRIRRANSPYHRSHDMLGYETITPSGGLGTRQTRPLLQLFEEILQSYSRYAILRRTSTN
ncbi:hypothetical protein TWF718_010820 [Orbilia javanica]|uniref:Uncharacterized protein n=1 Tax=Orbilia javanica TaxID=47235 RepID=A0AAN8MK51_9PEZI